MARSMGRRACGLIAAGFVLLAADPVPAWADLSSAVRQAAQAVKGLERPGEIVVDVWGIPHIYAGSMRDALFIQGYNAARDRLWQIDLWRKRGLGLLARDFGPAYVAQDRAARLFLYRGDLAAEWASYGAEAKGYAEAFVAGLNAFVEEIQAGRRALPVEFRVAGTRPDLWSADDVVRIRSHGLSRNLASEVQRARVTCAGGVEADRLRRNLEPSWRPVIPQGLDPCAVPREVLADYDLATREVSFTKPGQQRSARDPETMLAETDRAPGTVGSNAWTLSPARTATGRPILANDPHRAQSVPSSRYVVHLTAPGFSAIGAGEPALPGISIGHNGQIAFGLTVFAADQEDLYVYETNPDNPNEYRYNGGFEGFHTVRELVEVKGEAPREVELRFTRHGPVLLAEAQQHRAFALRTVWLEPGTSPYFASLDSMTARDWRGFQAASARWAMPAENQVYADVEGNIGWIVAGRAPIRPNWDGLFPVPGDGRYEWRGALSPADLPQAYNPPEGWIATANEMNLPPGFPYAERRIGFEWADPSRITRIKEVLAAKARMTLADAMALQTDDYTVNGRRLTRLLEPLQSDDPGVAEALRLLKDWDHRATIGSAGAAVYEAWAAKHLGRAVVARVAPEPARAIIGAGDLAAVTELLEHPDASLGDDPRGTRDTILLDSLREAVNELRQRLGPDSSGWTWGRLHHAAFEHALSPLADEATRTQMSVGRLAMGGSANSPRAAGFRASDFRVTTGASFRMVLDVGAWDNSVAVNAPGQSGDPFSPHYRSLVALWAAGDYVPLLFSREAVERAAGSVIRLTPAPPDK